MKAAGGVGNPPSFKGGCLLDSGAVWVSGVVFGMGFVPPMFSAVEALPYGTVFAAFRTYPWPREVLWDNTSVSSSTCGEKLAEVSRSPPSPAPEGSPRTMIVGGDLEPDWSMKLKGVKITIVKTGYVCGILGHLRCGQGLQPRAPLGDGFGVRVLVVGKGNLPLLGCLHLYVHGGCPFLLPP